MNNMNKNIPWSKSECESIRMPDISFGEINALRGQGPHRYNVRCRNTRSETVNLIYGCVETQKIHATISEQKDPNMASDYKGVRNGRS